MEEYPKMMLEFEKCFATEEACQEYLYQMRWPDGVICPGFSHREFWITKKECIGANNVGDEFPLQQELSFRIPVLRWCVVSGYLASG